MNNLTVFSNADFGQIRTIMIDDEPWFVGKDLADSLGYQNGSRDVNRHVDADDRAKTMLFDGYQNKETIIINESGMYSLIFGSRLESAKAFKRWVTSEVLPTLRKTGSYDLGAEIESYKIDDPIERAKRWIEEQEEKKLLESKIEADAPKVKAFDDLIDSKMLINFRDAAKEIGISQTQLTGWLIENKYIYKTTKNEIRPMEPYVASGLFKIKPFKSPNSWYTGSQTFLTPKGLATFKVIFENLGHTRHTMQKHGGRKQKNRNPKNF